MKRLLCLILLASLSGCIIPQREVLRPGASGAVIDAHTHQPVAGALITVEPPPVPAAGVLATKESASVRSQPDGSFRAPAYTAVRPYLVGGDMGLVRSPLLVEKPGYIPYKGQVSTFAIGNNDSAVRDVGTHHP